MALMYRTRVEFSHTWYSNYNEASIHYNALQFSQSGLTVKIKQNGLYFKVPAPNGTLNFQYSFIAYQFGTNPPKKTIDSRSGSATITNGYFSTGDYVNADRIMAFAGGYGGFDFKFSPLGAQNPRLVIDTEVTNAYVVSDLAINNSITDNDIVLTWTCLAQTEFLLKIKDANGVTVHEKQLASADKRYTIPARTLGSDDYTFELQAAFGYGVPKAFVQSDTSLPDIEGYKLGVVSPVASKQFTLSRVLPKIIAFEPNGVAQNRERPIAVTWTSENQHGYRLKIKQGGTLLTEYSGTTGTAVTIPANTLAAGLTTLELTLTYIPTWGTEANAVYASQTINFQAYGTPPMPVITTEDTVTTAFPKITWTASEQYTFRLQVLSGVTVVHDSGEVPSELPHYTLTNPLENGTYTLKLTVKNQYGIDSPEASKELNVSCEPPQKPVVHASGNDETGSISITVANTDTGNFKHCDLFRKLDGEWVRIAKEQGATFEYIDYLVKSDTTYQYMARAIGLTAGYQDSDIQTAKTSLVSTQLFEPSSPSNPINLRLQPSREETAHRNVSFMTYAGMQAPTLEFGEEQYSSVAASFFARIEDAERLKKLYHTASILCYRDNRGRFLYGFLSSDPVMTDEAYGWCSVRFTFTQTHYKEDV